MGSIDRDVLDELEHLAGPPSIELVGGRYRILRELGRGGACIVYEALDERLDQSVALKVLLERRDDWEVRTTREVRALATLTSPHVVRGFDTGDDPRVGRYVVLELVRGTPLRAAMTRGEPMRPDQALEIVEQLAAALDHAHERGVLHRDVKPENVLLVTEGVARTFVKLVDFGIARQATDGHVTRDGFVIGTPAYMAPERVLGAGESAAADRYALAVIALELLTGHTPHVVGTPAATLERIVAGRPRLPSRLGLDVPGLDAVFARALAQRPRARFERALDFSRALASVMATHREAPRPASDAHTPKKTRRAIAGALALVAVAATLWLGGWFSRRWRDVDGAQVAPAAEERAAGDAVAERPAGAPGEPR